MRLICNIFKKQTLNVDVKNVMHDECVIPYYGEKVKSSKYFLYNILPNKIYFFELFNLLIITG